MATLPHIAILGRPNVGKSTLFNRLVGRRTAIVDPTPGVTRDRIEGEFEWDGRKYRVSDLAGWDENPTNPFADETTEQIERISLEVEVILLLVDGIEGPNAWDKALSEKLRIVDTPVILVVNKCDTIKAHDQIDQFWELGMGTPLAISATHNLNVDELLDKIAEITADFISTDEDETGDDIITIALVGKQNVGKSTLFNAIIGDKRAIVSDIPGTTRDAIDTAIEVDGIKFLFIDTAGLKKQSKTREDIDYYATRRTQAALARAQIALLLLDATEGVTDVDKRIAGLIQETKRACVLISSKWDQSDDLPGQRAIFEKHVRKRLYFLEHATMVFTSGLNSEGLAEIFPAIVDAHAEFTKRVPTNEWNSALDDAVIYRPPPTIKGKRLKLNYITQTTTAPPTLTLFVNQPDFMKEHYRRYLERFFRRRFGFNGSPLIFQIRKKRSKKT